MQLPIRIIVFLLIAVIFVLLLAGTLTSLSGLRQTKKINTIALVKERREFTSYRFEFKKVDTNREINYNFSLN
jgi:hypothetical protein